MHCGKEIYRNLLRDWSHAAGEPHRAALKARTVSSIDLVNPTQMVRYFGRLNITIS
jgi:hypothetical protein